MPGGEAAKQLWPAIPLCHRTARLAADPDSLQQRLLHALVLAVLTKCRPLAHDKASTAIALLPMLGHTCTGCLSAGQAKVGSSRVMYRCPQELSSYTAVWHLCRGWNEEKQEWGWSREPPVSQQRGGDPNSPKKIRKKVGGFFLLLESGSSIK